jgi:hypothetical protein
MMDAARRLGMDHVGEPPHTAPEGMRQKRVDRLRRAFEMAETR